MNDIEISKALALAIGWKPRKIGQGQFNGVPMIGINEQASNGANSSTFFDKRAGGWCVEFDYRDPTVIWPIAERYNAFPYAIRTKDGKLTGKWNVLTIVDHIGDTAAKAVALAVIEMAQKGKK